MSMLRIPSYKYNKFKYHPSFFKDRSWPNKTIFQSPIWCSVDLRDGNQALIEPMNIEKKLILFKKLVDIGFKEIEVGFPSSSEIEFKFVQKLINENLIPDNVTIQVLTQAREELIEKTFASLKGAKKAIVHVYNATAPVMRDVVFKMQKNEILNLATHHVKLIKKLTAQYPDTLWNLEYSPEMFSNTEIDFSKKIIDAVTEIWEPSYQYRYIVNLPATVECCTPNIYADMVEWISKNLEQRDKIILSLHPHNDRGCAVAATELGLMAGADRVEGCLFGNGERTGNVDLVTLALNLYSQGITPNLNLSDIDDIKKCAEFCTNIEVHPRHPYAGELVYTSFSGSHQDAIKKAFANCKENEHWDMPYLPIDPQDVGRSYEAIIRVNSQSGKGGISYMMETKGFVLPRKLQIDFSQIVQRMAEIDNKEILVEEIFNLFKESYLLEKNKFNLFEQNIHEIEHGHTEIKINFELNNKKYLLNAQGNGPINAFINGVNQLFNKNFTLISYSEHALELGADSRAVTYIELKDPQIEKSFWGCGISENILEASFQAILTALVLKKII